MRDEIDTNKGSVLITLGQEVTRVIFPVSLCMLVTVVLLRILNPQGNSNSNAVYLASIYYDEKVGFCFLMMTSQRYGGMIL